MRCGGSDEPSRLHACGRSAASASRATRKNPRANVRRLWMAFISPLYAKRPPGLMPEQELACVHQRPEHVFPGLALVGALVDVAEGGVDLAGQRRSGQGGEIQFAQ